MGVRMSRQPSRDLENARRGDALHTIRFGVDGVVYEVSLTAERLADLRTQLAPYVASARCVGPTSIGTVS